MAAWMLCPELTRMVAASTIDIDDRKIMMTATASKAEYSDLCFIAFPLYYWDSYKFKLAPLERRCYYLISVQRDRKP